MIKHLILIGLFIICIFSSCTDKKFLKTPTGLEYMILNDGPKKLGNKGDIYDINISILDANDSIVLKSSLKFQRANSIYPGDFHEGLSLLSAGDSAIFKICSDSFFTQHGIPTPKSVVGAPYSPFHIGVKKIQSPIEHLLFMCDIEYKDITKYIVSKGWNMQRDSFGINYEITKKYDDARQVLDGDSVRLKYNNYTLNGKTIGVKNGNSWVFQVGDNQRISGLSRVLKFMKEGENIRAIIPFTEAFGENGLYPNIEPYTTVVMEIELLEIINE